MYQQCRSGLRSWVYLLAFAICAMITPRCASAQTRFFEFFGDGAQSLDYVGAAAAAGLFDSSDSNLDLVVGAPGDAAGGTVYVLHGPLMGSSISWTRLAHRLPVSGPVYYYDIGASMAYSSNFRQGQPVFIAGAPNSPSPANNYGRVGAYYQDATEDEAFLQPASLANRDQYGYVSASCDFNGDGYGDFVIGTHHHAQEAVAGAVYLFLGGASADEQEDLKIYPTYGAPVDVRYFGSVIAGVHDINNDGYDDILIGDPETGTSRVLIVYGRNLSQAVGSPALLPVANDGSDVGVKTMVVESVKAVAGGRDLSGDESPDIVILSQHGIVSIFNGPIEVGTDMQIALHAKLTRGSAFGQTLSMDADVDGDGTADLLIGDRGGVSGNNSGSVTVFIGGQDVEPGQLISVSPTARSTRGIWSVLPTWLVANARFGDVVGSLGDQNGDGRDEVFVGAPGMVNPSNINSGAIYGLDLAQSGIDIASTAVPVSADPGCSAGHLLAVQVDANTPIHVYANVESLGGQASLELLDDGSFTGEIANDGIYSAPLSVTITGTASRHFEVFAAADNPIYGFALKKNVELPVLATDLVQADAVYPLSSAYSGEPFLAVRIEDCGGTLRPNIVLLQPPAGFYGWSNVNLYDNGTNGDITANDGIWSYSGANAPGVIVAPGFYTFHVIALYSSGQAINETVQFQIVDSSTATFVNKSANVDLDYAGQPYSSVAIDFDGQGPMDLFVGATGEPGALFKAAQVSSSGTPLYVHSLPIDTGGSYPATDLLGLAVADYDNDGGDDLIATGQTTAQLFHRVAVGGAPMLQDVASSVIGTDALLHSTTPAWGDYDRDGYVDLFLGKAVVTGEPGVDGGVGQVGALFHNHTATIGGFSDVSNVLGGGSQSQYCTAATWCDINDDRYPDLFVGDCSGAGTTSRLFVNDKNGAFWEQADTRLSGAGLNTVVGAAFCDVNLDGKMDLVTARQGGADLRLNNGSGVFGAPQQIASGVAPSGLRVFDYDANGVSDVLVLSASEVGVPKMAKATLNGSSVAYSDVTSSVGLNWTGKIGGAVLSDFNSDGDLDLFLGKTVSAGSNFFTAAGVDPTDDAFSDNWIRVDIESSLGVPNNSLGIGAKVMVTQNGVTYIRYVDGGSGRGGQDHRSLLFSFPSASDITNLSVLWPNGYTQVVVDASSPMTPSGQVLVIEDDTRGFACVRPGASYDLMLCGYSSWRFSWNTDVGTDPSLDSVTYKIGDSNFSTGAITLHVGDEHVAHSQAVHATPAKPTGFYVHEMSITPVPCVVGQQIYFKVSSGAGSFATESSVFSFTTPVCTYDCPDPGEQ